MAPNCLMSKLIVIPNSGSAAWPSPHNMEIKSLVYFQDDKGDTRDLVTDSHF